MAREETAGPDGGPAPPFPIKLSGKVVKGFGRGSKELGIPTANLPLSGLDVGGHSDIKSGVYFGWTGISLKTAVADESQASGPPKPNDAVTAVKEQVERAVDTVRETLVGSTDGENTSNNVDDDAQVYPMVASIGYNPFYKNTVRSIEIHIMHDFGRDLYNATMNVSILGFIRHEQDYESLQALIDDINTDIDVTRKSLARPAYEEHRTDPYLTDFSGTAS